MLANSLALRARAQKRFAKLRDLTGDGFLFRMAKRGMET